MTNLENENKKQSISLKEGTGKFLDQQRQQIENTVSNISDTTNKVTNSVNEYQQTNRAILDKSIDASNKYHQESINTVQSIIDNTIELQKSFANTFQSVFSKFIDSTVKCTQRINNVALASTETFNKSIEIAQKYYNEIAQNYLNFVNKIEKSYYNNH